MYEIEYTPEAIDDFNREIESTRQNQELMKFLDERGKQTETQREARKRALDYVASRIRKLEKEVEDFAYDCGYDSDSDPDRDERGECDRHRDEYEEEIQKYRTLFKEAYDQYHSSGSTPE